MIHQRQSGQHQRSVLAAFAGICVLLLAGLAQAALEDEIRARLEPAGEVCVMGEECASGMTVASSGDGEARAPEMIYQTYCQACHGTGVNESPVLGNAADWAPRIEKGIDVLYENAINGFNNGRMPQKGLCMDCSQEEIQATVDYMVEAVQ